jgi:hypothetical protein
MQSPGSGGVGEEGHKPSTVRSPADYVVSGLSVSDDIAVGTPDTLGVSNKRRDKTPTTGEGSFPTPIMFAQPLAQLRVKPMRRRIRSLRAFPCFMSMAWFTNGGSISIDGHKPI